MDIDRFYVIVRHGEIEREKDSILGSGSDVPLNPEGLRQANALADVLTSRLGLEMILSSPMLRARQTASIIAQKYLGEVSVAEIQDLRAQAFGILEGQRVSIARLDGNLKPFLFENISPEERYTSQPPGGESLMQLADRTMDFINRLAREIKPEGLLLVTHQSVLRAIHGRIKGIPPFEWEHYFSIGYSECLAISPNLDTILQGSIFNNSFREI